MEEIVDVSSAQARLSADEAWSKADTTASLRHLQKATEGGLSVESLGVHVLRAVSTRASPLGDLTREVLRTSFTTVNTLESPVRQRDEQHPRGLRSKDRRRHDLHGVGCWSLLTICILNFLYAGNGHFHESRVCRNKPRPAHLAAIRRIVGDTTQDFAQVLKRKRVSYTGEEVSRPLTLLEIIPGLPPAGAVGIVDPLSIATGEVRKALADPRLVLLPESERVGVRPARVHAGPEEWNKIGLELLKRGVVSEAAREDAPVVDGQPVLVGAFWFEKRGTPLPPATRVLRLIVNAIPSNKQQTAIKGDIEQMPVGGEWLHIALETDEIVL